MPWSTTRRGDYIPLQSDQPEEGDVLSPAGEGDARKGHVPVYSAPQEAHKSTVMFWATGGVALSTLLSVILFAISLFSEPWGRSPTSTTQPSFPPTRPNPYVHLSTVLAKVSNSDLKPIVNFPPMTFQLNVSDSSRTMYEDAREQYTSLGQIFLDNRRIVVSPKTTTLMQFRNLDYAMERCVLVADIPVPGDKFDPSVSLADPTTVDVWRVDARTEISPYIGDTWHRAPKRLDLLTTLTFSHANASRSQEFPCPSGGFTTVELACSKTAGPDAKCHVDFWQDRRAKPTKGVYLIQHPGRAGERFW
ncbi:hypothetical protein OH77DRAFT_1446334 [Trametes cingulata]|nr:hypothetical protein OH77DRAFT_1446334 [Trametes cingulata]